MRRTIPTLLFLFLLTGPASRSVAPIPVRLADSELWSMVSTFSEPGGMFRFENFLSNEIYFQDVIPALKSRVKPGGIYMGVGPEQNFTYIVAVQPRIAFITDIRRQNMLELMMYKALFELAPNRADFISLLFSRKRPVRFELPMPPPMHCSMRIDPWWRIRRSSKKIFRQFWIFC